MAHLTTDFLKIAQAGPAVDGRYIREDWLRDMAETYDPKVYTALIWPEHLRWTENYGEVLELKAEPDDAGALCLYARLRPNSMYLWQNALGQKLFYSIEVEENFADSGKTYLGGLAVTDSPASLGMESTRFSARKRRPENLFVGNVPLMPFGQSSQENIPAERAETIGEQAPGWFRRLFPFLFTSDNGAGHTPELGGGSPETKDAAMDEAMEGRIAALEESIAALNEQVAAMAGRLDALEVDVAAGEGGDGSGDSGYKALAKHIKVMRSDFAALSAKLSAAHRPGTPAAPTTGPAGGKKLL